MAHEALEEALAGERAGRGEDVRALEVRAARAEGELDVLRAEYHVQLKASLRSLLVADDELDAACVWREGAERARREEALAQQAAIEALRAELADTKARWQDDASHAEREMASRAREIRGLEDALVRSGVVAGATEEAARREMGVAREEAREAVAAALLEKATSIKAADSRWKEAADARLHSAEASWQAQVAALTAERDETRHASERRVATLHGELAMARAQAHDAEARLAHSTRVASLHFGLVCSELGTADDAFTAHLASSEARLADWDRAAAQELDVLRAELRASDAEGVRKAAMADKMGGTIERMEAEGALVRAEHRKLAEEVAAYTARVGELEEAYARADGARGASEKLAEAHAQSLTEVQRALERSQTEAARAAEAAAQQLHAERRAAAEREARAVSATEQRLHSSAQHSLSELRASFRRSASREDAIRASMEEHWQRQRAELEAAAAAAPDAAAKSSEGAESRRREALQEAHAAELRAAAEREREAVAALERTHTSQIDATRREMETALQAARHDMDVTRAEVDAVRRQAAEAAASHATALASAESECHRLHAALREAEADVVEREALAADHARRAERLQEAIDAGSQERATRAKQSASEKMHLRSLAQQVETLGAQLAQSEAALSHAREERATSERLQREARGERDETLRHVWQLCEHLEALQPVLPNLHAGRPSPPAGHATSPSATSATSAASGEGAPPWGRIQSCVSAISASLDAARQALESAHDAHAQRAAAKASPPREAATSRAAAAAKLFGGQQQAMSAARGAPEPDTPPDAPADPLAGVAAPPSSVGCTRYTSSAPGRACLSRWGQECTSMSDRLWSAFETPSGRAHGPMMLHTGLQETALSEIRTPDGKHPGACRGGASRCCSVAPGGRAPSKDDIYGVVSYIVYRRLSPSPCGKIGSCSRYTAACI